MTNHSLSKIILPCFTLLLLLSLVNNSRNYAAEMKGPEAAHTEAESGTLQKMIVENGSVTMEIDVNRLNGITSPVGIGVSSANQLHFTVAANSLFSILVFNDLLRGPEAGSIALITRSRAPALPEVLSLSLNQLVIEKLPSDAAFDLAVRDGKTGFTFFNIEGHEYQYDADSRSLTISGGKLLLSKAFATALRRQSDAGAFVGKISLGAAMQPIEVQTIVNGETKS